MRINLIIARFLYIKIDLKRIIDLLYLKNGKYSGKVLETITHNEIPWKEARTDYKPLQPSREIIE